MGSLQYRKLTSWEYLLLGTGGVFAIAGLLNAYSSGGQPVPSLYSVLWLPVAITFVVFGGKHRKTAFVVLFVLAVLHLVMSYTTEVWVDKIANLDQSELPPGAVRNAVGSIPWFAFVVAVTCLTVLIAAKLTFSGARPHSENRSD